MGKSPQQPPEEQQQPAQQQPGNGFIVLGEEYFNDPKSRASYNFGYYDRDGYKEKLAAIDQARAEEEAKDPGIIAAQRRLDQSLGLLDQEKFGAQNMTQSYNWWYWTPGQRASVAEQWAQRVADAKNAVTEAEVALNVARNDYAGKRWADHLQAQRDEKAKEEQGKQELFAEIEKTDWMDGAKPLFLASGGTAKGWEQAAESLWQEEIRRRVAEKAERERQRSLPVRDAF